VTRRPAAFFGRRTHGPRTGVLIIVQNLPVPFDRRVWLECQALVADGFTVSVICPKGPDDPKYQEIDGVSIWKFRGYAPGGSAIAYLLEYVHSFLITAWLTLRVRRHNKFKILQACNPPDIFWPIALFWKLFGGTKFVFDHHDLCPELYQSRFPNSVRAPYWGLRLLERMTHRCANHVIATNESYRQLAITRSGKQPDEVTVVRSGPDLNKLHRVDPVPALKRGRSHLVAYIGVMGPQDGVDNVVHAADYVVNRLERTDVSFTLIGGGDCFDELVALRDKLGLQDYVEFTGRIPDAEVASILSTADIGLSPDPKNPLNDLSTMNKTVEYMAFALPVVAFDLHETRVSAADAAVYVGDGDLPGYATAISYLLDDPARRQTMARSGLARIRTQLSWSHQRDAYVGVYRALLPKPLVPEQLVDLTEHVVDLPESAEPSEPETAQLDIRDPYPDAVPQTRVR
jgi:glycosyltransferase involved in cell wall biosynthesis